jgi:tetratricopeptide (TPR) repeat protein/SAM-dependent methyltransferase
VNRKQRRAQKDAGPASPPPEIAQIFAAAAQYHQAGRLAEAEQLYRRILAAAPRHADSLHRLGLIAYQTGRLDMAVDLLRQAITQDKKAARYHAHLSLALGALGQLEEAVAASRAAIRIEPNQPDSHNNLGVLLMQLGRLDEAADCYRQAIALGPGIADTHNNLGNVLLALGRAAEAAESYRQAIGLAPDYAQAQTALGNALMDLGQMDEAILQHRKAIELRPEFADAHNNLGNALWKLGQLDEAARHFRTAIGLNPDFVLAISNLGGVLKAAGQLEAAAACFQQALQRMPEHPGILGNLASTLLALGDGNGAAGAIIRSLTLQETAENRKNFVACVKDLRIETGADVLRPWLLRALREAWDRPGDLARIAADVIMRAHRDKPDALAKDELLQALLVCAPNVDMALERLLTGARRALLDAALQGSQIADMNFAAALARQCFINEYVFAQTEDEAAQVRRLRDNIASALEKGAPVSASCLVAVAAYLPLSAMPLADRLLDQSWPAVVEAVLTQQIREPREEAELRATIPRLTPIEDAGSRLVRSQYEGNPYPRWVAAGAAQALEDLTDHLRQTFPFADVAQAGSADGLDILIAGCGTGRNAIETAQRLKNARTLAIDLSLASLAHAARKARERNVPIDFAQADILALGSLDRRFDLIESVGVLHHLADPFAGWRVLLSLLRPNGVMKLGFYSAVARRRLPDLNADAGTTADAVRAARQTLAGREDEQSREALRAPDFYSISSCRDLLFHVQERRLTLAEIGSFLDENGLKFIGFAIDDAMITAYRRRFPDDKAAANLVQWQDFENDNPDTFSGMYQFWVQRA